jgi:hypothetical protein
VGAVRGTPRLTADEKAVVRDIACAWLGFMQVPDDMQSRRVIVDATGRLPWELDLNRALHLDDIAARAVNLWWARS